MMERTEIAEGLTLSRLVYGMWRLADDPDTSPARVRAKMEACLDQGLTTMDQADIYADYGAEELLGYAFKSAPDLRERVELVTKCDIVAPVGKYATRRVKYYDTSRAHIMASVDNSLAMMATDRVELLLLHRPDPLMDPEETGRALDDLVAAGKTRHVGVSNFRPRDWELLQSAMHSPLVTNQIEISVLAHAPFTNGDLAFLQRERIHPMAWSPLAGGALFTGAHPRLRAVLARVAQARGVSESAVAVAWLLAHPAGILPVMGTNSLSRIAALSEAFEVPMDRETWFEIYTAALGHEVP